MQVPFLEKEIGGYKISKTIGEGTFGKVKLGHHVATGEKVAIKILEKKKISDVSDVERVSRELHILKLIRHPHIVQLYEIIETSKRIYLIMEYANGGELFDFIVSSSKLSEDQAAKFYLQLLSGIEYIHKLGVVHRDLKPENLLIDNTSDIKIVDFGLSNTYQPNEKLKTACGSPCYAAPEMVAGQQYDGLKADIWSSGVILFAMACGFLPFEDSDTSKLYKKILAGRYELPESVSYELSDLLKKILNTNPENRIGIAEIREHRWFKTISQPNFAGLLVGHDHIMVDETVLKSIQQFGYDTSYARKCIEANKHNNITAGYYLLLKKHITNGGTSIADCSHQQRKIKAKTVIGLSYTPFPPLIKLSNENLLPAKFRKASENRNSDSNSHIKRRSNSPCLRENRKNDGRNTSHAIDRSRRYVFSSLKKENSRNQSMNSKSNNTQFLEYLTASRNFKISPKTFSRKRNRTLRFSMA